jgi:hypothetical protein
MSNDPRYDAARMTDQSNGRGWNFDPAPFTAIDVVGVLLKPSTLISLTVLAVCVWGLCGFPGLV